MGVSEAGDAQKRDYAKTRVVSTSPRVGGRAGEFEESPIDLTEIGRAYYTDSYVMRAINKIVGLMFKSGWNFNGSNQDSLDYVKARFELMSESTEIAVNELIRELGFNYVLYSNAALVKTRGTENLAELEAEGYYGGEPISGLFNIPPERLQVQRDEFGNIEAYMIMSDEGDDLELKPEDVIHLTHNKPSGRTYGVPHISSVIDDVLILRQLEENVVRMVYRNIHPLMTYKAGLAEPGYEATDEEIQEIAATIDEMPLDSMLVLSERHTVETVSNKNGILDAYDYLRYFRQRVFTGLGVSESTMGIGDSSNRSTSDNQSSDLIDLVKDFQINFQDGLQRIVNEILYEGGYDPVLNKEDYVSFEFVEIEQSVMIARENHELMKYMSNAQSIDEYRKNIGKDPITDEELDRFYVHLIKKDDSEGAKNQVDNENQPENQHGKQDGPVDNPKEMSKKSNKTSFLEEKDNSRLTKETCKVSLAIDSEEKAEITEKVKGKISQLVAEVSQGKQLTPYVMEQWVNSLPASAFDSEEDKETFAFAVKAGVSTYDSIEEESIFLLEDTIIIYYNHLKEVNGENS